MVAANGDAADKIRDAVGLLQCECTLCTLSGQRLPARGVQQVCYLPFHGRRTGQQPRHCQSWVWASHVCCSSVPVCLHLALWLGMQGELGPSGCYVQGASFCCMAQLLYLCFSIQIGNPDREPSMFPDSVCRLAMPWWAP